MISGAEVGGLARSLVTYYGQPWRRRGLRRLYAGLIRPGDLAFDVGAHVGNRSRTLHSLGARVVAVEPQPLFRRVLKRLLPVGRTHLVEKAVGASPGRATLHVSARHPTVSTLSSGFIEAVRGTRSFSAVEWNGAVEVEVTTLDALIAEFGRPDFVKIDVEGHEAAILCGLSQPVALLAFEFVPEAPETLDACLVRLATLGSYRYNFVAGEGHRFALPEWGDEAALRSALDGAARSGDVYARLSAVPPS